MEYKVLKADNINDLEADIEWHVNECGYKLHGGLNVTVNYYGVFTYFQVVIKEG